MLDPRLICCGCLKLCNERWKELQERVFSPGWDKLSPARGNRVIFWPVPQGSCLMQPLKAGIPWVVTSYACGGLF